MLDVRDDGDLVEFGLELDHAEWSFVVDSELEFGAVVNASETFGLFLFVEKTLVHAFLVFMDDFVEGEGSEVDAVFGG